MTKNKDFLSKYIIRIITILAVIAIVLAVVTIGTFVFKFHTYELSNDSAYWGQFGDFIGGTLNPIFGFFAFIALLITIIIQNRELSVSSEELSKSASALKLQNIENTFFQMVRLHNDIVNAFHINNEINGRNCFKEYYADFEHYYQSALEFTAETEDNVGEIIEDSYNAFFDNWQADLGHYFRNLYNIVKYIDKHSDELEHPKQYTNIIRAQLSTYELALLFYNCQWSVGKEKFYPLIEKYELLNNLNPKSLLGGKDRKYGFNIRQYSLYSKAYGDKKSKWKEVNKKVDN